MFKWPIVLIAIGWALGIFLYAFFPTHWSILLMLLGAALLGGVCIHFWGSRLPFWSFPLAVFLMSICLGALALQNKNRVLESENKEFLHESLPIVQIQLIQKQKSNSFYQKWLVRVEAIAQDSVFQKAHSTVLLRIPMADSLNLHFNQQYLAQGRAQRIRPAMAPFGFDYSCYMKQKGVLFQITVDTLIPESKLPYRVFKNPYLDLLYSIDSSGLSVRSKEVLKALALGDRSDMNPETTQVFSLAGIIHLFAISGLHIGLIFGILYFGWIRLLGFKYRRAAIVISLCMVVLYGAFIQFPTSVSRAIIMLVMYYGFQIMNRPSLPYHSWALAALVLMIINPYLLFEVGFQLSFAAVFFILWMYPVFKKNLLRWPRMLRDLFAVTLAAQLGTLPLGLYYFHQMSLVGIFLNVVIIPFAGLMVLVSFLELITLSFFPHWNAPIVFYNAMCDGLYFLAEKSAFINGSWLQNISFTAIEVWFLWLVIGLLKVALEMPISVNWYRLSQGVFLFLLVRFGVTLWALQSSELVVYNVYKNTVVSVKKGNTLWVLSELPTDENFYQYTLRPYWLHRRKPSIYYQKLPVHSLEVEGQSLCLIRKEIPPNSSKNSIWILQHSPRLDWNTLLTQPHKILLLDGSNYPNYCQEFKKYVEKNQPNTHFKITAETGYYWEDLSSFKKSFSWR